MKFCIDCGAELPITAKFCPNCGKRIENIDSADTENLQSDTLQYGTFILLREQTNRLNGAVSKVYVDNKEAADVYPFLGAKIHLPVGNHEVEIKIDKYSAKRIIEIQADKTEIITHKIDVFDNKQGLAIGFSARDSYDPAKVKDIVIPGQKEIGKTAAGVKHIPVKAQLPQQSSNRCKVCGGEVSFQTIAEKEPIESISILGLGLLVVFLGWLDLFIGAVACILGILFITRSANKTVTYAVCRECGYREKAEQIK